MTRLDRRDALKRIAVGSAAAVTSPLWIETLISAAEQHAARYHQAATAAAPWVPKVLSPTQNQAVIALSEAIIPQTDTAGAAKAGVNRFIDAVMADASPADRQKFLDGLAWIDARSQRDAAAPFAKATAAQQMALLTTLSTATAPSPDDAPGVEFFTAIKSLTITGYYTSEVGMREEMGDTGQMFFLEYPGCTHEAHKK
jgi:gluconate 2-dehydrogenase gamma chain